MNDQEQLPKLLPKPSKYAVKSVIFDYEFKLHLTRLARKCLAVNGFESWFLSMKFECQDSDDAWMRVNADTQYKRVRVTVYPSIVELWDLQIWDRLAAAVMHEICHLYTEPIDEFWGDRISQSERRHFLHVIESATQGMAFALMGQMDQTWYLPNVLEKMFPVSELYRNCSWLLPLAVPIDGEKWTYDLSWKSLPTLA